MCINSALIVGKRYENKYKQGWSSKSVWPGRNMPNTTILQDTKIATTVTYL